jgi:23S rRNA pseudouridine955/2504/2580 synthase
VRKCQFRVRPEESGFSLGKLLAVRFPAISPGKRRKLLARGQVKLAGKIQKDATTKVKVGWSVATAVPGDLGNSPVEFELAERALVYQDAAVVVVVKPAGVKVHRNHPNETTVTMTEATQALTGDDGLSLVHRLDRGTSGLLVFARTQEAAKNLGRQFARRTVEKRYLALVEGSPPEQGEVDRPLVRREGVAQVDPERGKPSRTRFRTLSRGPRHSLVQAEPVTGRTHQIRAHLAHEGFPLAGDLPYGGRLGIPAGGGQRAYDLPGAMLHCAGLTFHSPAPGAGRVEVEAPLPRRFRTAMDRAGVPAPRKPRRTEAEVSPEAPPEQPRRPRRTPLRDRAREPARTPRSRPRRRRNPGGGRRS